MRALLVVTLLLSISIPARAQLVTQVEPVLQHLIDLPEMDEVFESAGIRDSLYVLSSPVLPPTLELTKFGTRVRVINAEEGFFKGLSSVRFIELSADGASRISARIHVFGPGKVGSRGPELFNVVLRDDGSGWQLESFERGE